MSTILEILEFDITYREKMNEFPVIFLHIVTCTKMRTNAALTALNDSEHVRKLYRELGNRSKYIYGDE